MFTVREHHVVLAQPRQRRRSMPQRKETAAAPISTQPRPVEHLTAMTPLEFKELRSRTAAGGDIFAQRRINPR